MAASCSPATFCGNVKTDCFSAEGCKQNLKYVGVALAVVAALGLALALTMRFSPTVANSTVGQFLSQAVKGKLMTYVLAGSSAVLGALTVGRLAKACNVI